MGLFSDDFTVLKKASEPLYNTPKSIQDTIEILKVAKNEIFQVARGKYSKCYRFQDLNYTTTSDAEQKALAILYCRFLNSLDCNYKITVSNKMRDMISIGEFLI